MTSRPSGAPAKQIESLFRSGTSAGLADGQLLDRFLAREDEAAFTALIERHGPMVLRVCRGVLGDASDAEDAFQATFLVLVRRAGSIRRREAIGSWLFGVAGRVAARLKTDAARRRRHERRAAEAAERCAMGQEPDDQAVVLHDEVGRLPEKYRAPIVLCHFQGRSYDEAAKELGWPIGTLKTRLSRARDRLRQRLARHGLVVPTLLPMAESVTRSSPATVSEGRSVAVGRYLEKTKAEVDSAVNDLRAEVEDLRVRLAQAASNLRRMEALQTALKDEGTPSAMNEFFKYDVTATYHEAKQQAKPAGAPRDPKGSPRAYSPNSLAPPNFDTAPKQQSTNAPNDPAGTPAKGPTGRELRRRQISEEIDRLMQERNRLGTDDPAQIHSS